MSCNWAALPIRLWDVVELNIPEIFQVGTTFRVTEFSFAEGGGIDLTLSSERPEFYYWNYLSDEKIIESTKKPVSDNGKPDPVANLVISGEPRYNKPYLSIKWNSPSNDRLNFNFNVVIERRDKNQTIYQEFRRFTTSESEFSQELPDEDIPYLYRAKVRKILFFGRSDWVISNTVEIKQILAPLAPPSYISVSSEGDQVTIRWKTPPNVDYKHSVIYHSPTNDIGQAVILSSVEAQKDSYTSYIDTVKTSSYYWISSVDISGDESVKIFAGSVII